MKTLIILLIGIVIGISLSYTPLSNQYIQPYEHYVDISNYIN